MSTTLSSPRSPHPSGRRPPRRPAVTERPRWELPGLAVLLSGTAVLYLWDLGATGYGNSFYAAAVQAGTTSWKAFFFGSLDSANLITVDKPPASLWVMELSARVFGFSSWSMLVPQALMAVAAVALLWATVRRISGPAAGLLAGALLALTPVAALMFRFNNPDAFLALLLVAAGYVTVRAMEQAGTRWILLAGLLVGFAFLAKEMQAFLVLPGLALAYLWAAPTSLGRRIAQLLGPGSRSSSAPGGGSSPWRCGPPPTGPGSVARPTTPSSAAPSATTVWAGSSAVAGSAAAPQSEGQRRPPSPIPRSEPMRRAAPVVSVVWVVRPGSCGCSRRRSVARSPGCCPPR